MPSIDDLKRYFEAASNLPWWILCAAFTFAVGLALRRWEKFPNQAIPSVLLALCAILTMLLAPAAPAGTKLFQWRLTNFIIGGVIGFLVWGFHAAILKRLAAKWPWLDQILTGGDDYAAAATVPTAAPVAQQPTDKVNKP